jgi:hypothetical protein
MVCGVNGKVRFEAFYALDLKTSRARSQVFTPPPPTEIYLFFVSMHKIIFHKVIPYDHHHHIYFFRDHWLLVLQGEHPTKKLV